MIIGSPLRIRIADAQDRFAQAYRFLSFRGGQKSDCAMDSAARYRPARFSAGKILIGRAELADHLAHDCQLLVVLLTEPLLSAAERCGTVFSTTVAMPRKMSWAESPLELFGDFRQIDIKGLPARDTSPSSGAHTIVLPSASSFAPVLRPECAGLLEIFALSELQPVEENGGHRDGAMLRAMRTSSDARRGYAHGRHARDLCFTLEAFAQFSDCLDEFHFFFKAQRRGR